MDQETFALRDVLHILRHHRWRILGTVAVAVLAALVISFAQPKRYTAETQLVVGPAIPPAALPEAPAGTDAGPLGLDLPAETQARIVASPVMTARVARNLRLPSDPAVIRELTKRVQVKAVTDNVLLITVNAPSSLQAAALANEYAQAFLDYRRETARNALRALSSDYQRRAQEAQEAADELNQQIKKAADQGANGDVARLTNQRNDLLAQVRVLTRSARRASWSQASEYSSGGNIAPASPPAHSSSPNRIRNVLIAIVLGGAAGVSVALFREHVNDRVRTRDEAARAANAPVLASLPKRRRQAKSELVTVRAPEAMASEEYRQLHRNLVRRGLGRRVRRLLVTSVEAGAPTSETAANLGVLCARTGQATAAIAADLRHSRLHEYFQIPEDKPGLGTILAAEQKWPGEVALSAFGALVIVTEGNLLVVPSGTPKFRPGKVFSSAWLDHIFDLASNIAELLIIEAPPILGSDDAITLTAHADATLLVVRAGVDKEALTARAAAILETAGSPLIGVVLHNTQKDDETIGLFERRRIEPDQLPPSIPSDGKLDLSRLGNGHPSGEPPIRDADAGESARSPFGEQRPDAN